MNKFKNILKEVLSCHIVSNDIKIPLKLKTIICRLLIIIAIYILMVFSLTMLFQYIGKIISKGEHYKVKIIEIEK